MPVGRTQRITPLHVRLQEGSKAPRYDNDRRAYEVDAVVITEQGTVSGLPIVDVVMRHEDGGTILATFTGREICGRRARHQHAHPW